MPREQHIEHLTDDEGKDHTYSIVPLAGGAGWKVLCKLVGMVGGAAGRSLGAITPANVAAKVAELSSVLDGSFDGEGLASAIEKVASQLLADDKMLTGLLAGVGRDGRALDFDEAYAGNYGELFAAIVAVLKINYGPFFRRILGELARTGVLAKLEKALTSSKTLETAG